jgi:hypothetical protein
MISWVVALVVAAGILRLCDKLTAATFPPREWRPETREWVVRSSASQLRGLARPTLDHGRVDRLEERVAKLEGRA